MAVLIGTVGNDTLIGTLGNDIFEPLTSLDSMIPGDEISLTGPTDGKDLLVIDYTGDMTGGISTSGGVDGSIFSGDFRVTYRSIEQFSITGTNFDDVMRGGALRDTLDGATGNDLIEGLGGADLINGGNGNDTLRGGSGRDTINGGNGKDVLNGGTAVDTLMGGADNDVYIVGASDVVIENMDEGADTIISAASFTLGLNVEHLRLSGTKNRSGTGNSTGNNIIGNSGRNILLGLGGSDRLNGGGGNDLLNGGVGVDILTGGAGADSFEFSSPTDGTDRIADFSSIEGDMINLSSATFIGLSNENLDDNFVLGTKAVDNDDFLVYDQASGRLIYDANANMTGGTTVVALLGAGTALGASNIQIVVI